MIHPCLDCGLLTGETTRCPRCKSLKNRVASSIGRQWRGPRWKQVSERLRRDWADRGFGCIDAADGKCRGAIQADHMRKEGPYVPRCAYHNNRKH